MKVYRAKRNSRFHEIGQFNYCQEGDFFCEQEATTGRSYRNKSYPVYPSIVEDNSDLFEFVMDDTEHDSDYYIKPIYTQYQLDQKLKNNQQ